MATAVETPPGIGERIEAEVAGRLPMEDKSTLEAERSRPPTSNEPVELAEMESARMERGARSTAGGPWKPTPFQGGKLWIKGTSPVHDNPEVVRPRNKSRIRPIWLKAVLAAKYRSKWT